jgi:acyl-CoA thioester hydrolase
MTPHLLPIRVYFEDTDFTGVVYHASYLRFFERGRTEFLRDLGIGQRELHAGDEPLAFVVTRMVIDWLRPARMDDIVSVETRAVAIKGASMLLAQRLLRGEEVLTTAEVTVACVAHGRPTRLPPAVRDRLGAFAGAASPRQTGENRLG